MLYKEFRPSKFIPPFFFPQSKFIIFGHDRGVFGLRRSVGARGKTRRDLRLRHLGLDAQRGLFQVRGLLLYLFREVVLEWTALVSILIIFLSPQHKDGRIDFVRTPETAN